MRKEITMTTNHLDALKEVIENTHQEINGVGVPLSKSYNQAIDELIAATRDDDYKFQNIALDYMVETFDVEVWEWSDMPNAIVIDDKHLEDLEGVWPEWLLQAIKDHLGWEGE